MFLRCLPLLHLCSRNQPTIFIGLTKYVGCLCKILLIWHESELWNTHLVLKLLMFQLYGNLTIQVHFELKHHAPQLKRIIDDQHARLSEAQNKILKVEERQSRLEERIDHAVQQHNSLEQRLQHLRNLPGAHKKPLSGAEHALKAELGK